MPATRPIDHRRSQRKKQLLTNPYVGFGGALVLAATTATVVSVSYGAGWGDGLRWLLYALSAFGFSAIIGLIFGVPRARSVFVADATERYESNSNLEQISDWLTKLLVGAGLVQLNRAPEVLASLGSYLGNEMKVPNSSAYSITAVLFGAGLGFIFGYVWTRLRLRVFLEKSDRLASEASRTGTLIDTLRMQNEKASQTESELELAKAAEKAVEARESASITTISAVLWVDDNPHNNISLINALRSLDIEVELALSTAEAMKSFDSRDYGLIISDLGRQEDMRYNELAGLDLINAVRSRDKTIPIFIFAGGRAVDMQDELIRAGASLVTTRASVLLEQTTRAVTMPWRT